jgi:site-specific DNA recombinase
LKGVIYARYSSDNQRQESIEAQVRAIKDYAIKNNITIIKIYADEELSGKTDKRPQFLEMIAASEKKLFQIVLIHKIDRFARNRYDAVIYKKKLKDNGVKIISILENLDDSPESIILESLLQGMAEYYSANLSREVMKGMKETAYQAKHNGGIPPLGLDVAPDKSYKLNEKEAAIVKEIFRMYLDGYGYTLIAKSLNDRGIGTKSARLFTKISIRDILQNEKYVGTYVFNRRADGKTLNKLKDDSEIIRVPDALPIIIEKSDFEKVQDMLKNRKRGPKMKQQFYMLTGILECGECGSAYTGSGYVSGRNKNEKYYPYSCVGRKKNKTCKNKPIRKEIIENYVIRMLKEKIFNIPDIERLSKELAKKILDITSEHKNQLKEAQKRIKEID